MKTVVVLLLALALAACANETTDVVTPPVVETPAPSVPVEEPEMAPEVEIEELDEEMIESEPDPVVEEEPEESNDDTGPRVFTLAELATYNGQNGQPAYVAVDGVVYDVTNHPSWRGGSHRGVQAGQDVSNMIPASHRADMRFEANPIVGVLG